MALMSARGADFDIGALARDPGIERAISWLSRNLDWVTEQQIRLTEIPAPEFSEYDRALALRRLFESAGLKVRMDSTGNVIGERAGKQRNDIVLLVAHLDTVFPAGTDVRVKRDGKRLRAPGIADNGAGLAALIAVAKAMDDAKLHTELTIAFAGDVGEEGEGNLRGIRAIVEEYRDRLRAVIALDGAATDYVTTQGLASLRIEAAVTGPGGHSWSDFGAPNPITALSRGIVKFSSISVPDSPRTSFNFGMIEGGTSINSIPGRAAVKVDLRSEDEMELKKLESQLREALQSGVNSENAAAQRGNEALRIEFKTLGVRPGGKLPANSALLGAISSVDAFLGNAARQERSSTDANLPLSIGIPAIAIGGGGQGGGSHSLDEWYDPADRIAGLKRVLLATYAIAQSKS
jgi:tripeptide aminopeptidase